MNRPVIKRRLVSNGPVSDITTLPVEILDIILGIVLRNAFRSIMTKPIFVFRQYRALIMTCKRFRFILDNALPRIAIHRQRVMPRNTWQIQIWDLNIHGSTISETELNSPNTQVLTHWSNFFQTFQKFCLRHIEVASYDYAKTRLGKFWLNPMITLDDFKVLRGNNPYFDTELISHLGGIFQRYKRHPTKQEHKQFKHVPWPYCTSEIINITSLNGKKVAYSVRNWKVQNNDCLSSKKVANEVSEWWILDSYDFCRDKSFIAGYYRGRAWVVDVRSGTVHTNERCRGWR